MPELIPAEPELWQMTTERLRVMYLETFGHWPPDTHDKMRLVQIFMEEARNA